VTEEDKFPVFGCEVCKSRRKPSMAPPWKI